MDDKGILTAVVVTFVYPVEVILNLIVALILYPIGILEALAQK